MKLVLSNMLLCILLSCNKIESGNTLSKSDIAYLESINLLDKDEKVYKFYSQYNTKLAGNFYTDKKIASYWIDSRNEEKNEFNYALYKDIVSIDTTYSTTYNSYITISYITIKDKRNGSFQVYINGDKKIYTPFLKTL